MQICLIALQGFFLAGKCLHDFFGVILVHDFFLAVIPPPPTKTNGSPLKKHSLRILFFLLAANE